jgi:hypothetical protein
MASSLLRDAAFGCTLHVLTAVCAALFLAVPLVAQPTEPVSMEDGNGQCQEKLSPALDSAV